MTNKKSQWEATASDEAFGGWTTLSARLPEGSNAIGTHVVLVFVEDPFEAGASQVQGFVLDADGESLDRWDAPVPMSSLRAWAVATAKVLSRLGEDYDLDGVADLTEGDLARALDL